MSSPVGAASMNELRRSLQAEALPDADQFSVVIDFTVLPRAHTYVAGGTGVLLMNGNSSVALSCSDLREIFATLRTSAS